MAEQPPSPQALAFFRWQEWVAFRRHVDPTSRETCGDLLVAEAKVLAAMGEHEAAAGAAARALVYYNAHEAESGVDLGRKLAEARDIAGAARVPQQVGSAADPEMPDFAALGRDREALAAGIRARISGLNARTAQDAVRTLNAFRSTRFGATPFEVRVVTVPSAPPKDTSSLTPFVLDLAYLELRDPETFRVLVQWLVRKASTRSAGASGLELPDLPETGTPT